MIGKIVSASEYIRKMRGSGGYPKQERETRDHAYWKKLQVPGSQTSQSIAAYKSLVDEGERVVEVAYKDIVTVGIVLATHIISKDHLAAGIVGIASITEELGDVLDILVAAAKLMLTSSVIDADEEGLLE
jgi:hypothetical protein